MIIYADEIERLNKKLSKLKGTHVIQAQAKVHEKKIAQTEGNLKSMNQWQMYRELRIGSSLLD